LEFAVAKLQREPKSPCKPSSDVPELRWEILVDKQHIHGHLHVGPHFPGWSPLAQAFCYRWDE
jgi:hypothetical protein